MIRCMICRFLIETEDDIGFVTPRKHHICLKCWNRDTTDDRRMESGLRREVQQATKD